MNYREIVKEASRQVGNYQAKSWLWYDEKGSWEETAKDLHLQVVDRAMELGLGDVEVSEQIAGVLALMAVEVARAAAAKGKLDVLSIIADGVTK